MGMQVCLHGVWICLMLELLFGHACALACSYAGAVVWASVSECACWGLSALMLNLLFGHLSVSVPACWGLSALMLELLFGHMWGAECSAVLAVVWACECASDGALMLELWLVGHVPAWGVNCPNVL